MDRSPPPPANSEPPLSRRMRRWFRPRSQRFFLIVALLLMALFAVVSVLLWQRQERNRRQAETVATLWQRYRTALERFDAVAVEAALRELLSLQPDNAAARTLVETWNRKQSTPETLELAPVLLLYHLRQSDLGAARREAEQILQRYPHDWLAHCVRLHALLSEHNGDAAVTELAIRLWQQFPDPEDETARTTPAGLLYALRLAGWLQQDDVPLRRIIERRVLPLLSSPRTLEATPLQQLHLVECFLAVSELPESSTGLTSRWVAVEQLVILAVGRAKQDGDADALHYWLTLAPSLEQMLIRWQRGMPLRFPAKRLEPLRQQLRQLRWEAANVWRALQPDRPEAYLYLAELAWLDNQLPVAFQHYLDALRNCPQQMTVWERFLPFLSRYGSRTSLEQTAQALWKQAETAGNDERLWCLAAQASLAAQHYEQTLEACQRVRQLQPRHAAACVLEAAVWSRSGEWKRARTALETLDAATLRRLEEAARLYGRCLAADAASSTIEQQYRRLFPGSPSELAAAAFLRGVGEGTASADLLRWAVQQAQKGAVQGRPAWCRCYVELRYRLAEAMVRPHPAGGPAVWEQESVTAALAAFQLLTPEQRCDPAMLLARGTLLTFGRQQPEAARRLVEPLLEQPLSAQQRLALAFILLANKRPRQALELLQTESPEDGPAPAGLWIARAWAYHELKRLEQVQHAVICAELAPYRSAREQADLVALKHRLQRETPP